VAWSVEVYDSNRTKGVRPGRWTFDSERDAQSFAADIAHELRRSPPPGYCVFGSARRNNYSFRPDGTAGLTITQEG